MKSWAWPVKSCRYLRKGRVGAYRMLLRALISFRCKIHYLLDRVVDRADDRAARQSFDDTQETLHDPQCRLSALRLKERMRSRVNLRERVRTCMRAVVRPFVRGVGKRKERMKRVARGGADKRLVKVVLFGQLCPQFLQADRSLLALRSRRTRKALLALL